MLVALSDLGGDLGFLDVYRSGCNLLRPLLHTVSREEWSCLGLRQGPSCGTAGCLFVLLAYMGCVCFYSSGYRGKLRSQYQLQEAPCNDCLVHCCCSSYAWCQEYRELRTRGLDPSLAN
ncbi:hypothetical protein H6P81_002864 [Aristolochia fimbriata]|uniref:Uncharacterized protein n=1 Tax=Aristolochia fimbriata TaxID=158543 RepID=A0AAV7FET7_ARIFI|nr:hypothetical protein H6P81_002864 [Aristolochia fimbriata]